MVQPCAAPFFLASVLALVSGAWSAANTTISFANPQAATPVCGSTSPYVGFNGLLTTLDHKVSGMVTVIDDCTFQVAMFTYDGMGPATFWAGAPNLADLTAAKDVTVLNGQQLTKAYTGTQTITVPLLSGVTWQNIGVISAWCTEFKADFGHVVLAAKVSSPAASPASCTKNSAYVGFNGVLSTLDHKIGGKLTIIDDCTFQVAMFTYDGMGPATYWSSAPSLADLTAAKDVTVINKQQLTKAYNGTQTITVPLLAGITWSDVGVISAWCTEFKADFGHVVINAVKVASPGAAPACATTSPYVGFNGALTTLDHKVAGTVEIVNDCLFEVEGFIYDGMGPATYWAGAPSLADLTAAKNVVVINDKQLKQAYNGTETIVVPLNATLDGIGVISAWCTEFKADFGHVVLKALGSPAAAPAATPASATPAAAPTATNSTAAATPSTAPVTAPATAPAPAPSAAAWQHASLPAAIVASALLGAALL